MARGECLEAGLFDFQGNGFLVWRGAEMGRVRVQLGTMAILLSLLLSQAWPEVDYLEPPSWYVTAMLRYQRLQ